MNLNQDVRRAVDIVEAFGFSVILDADPIHCFRCGEVQRLWRDDEENLYSECPRCKKGRRR